eukprot:CAMPEP_0168557886 /NCGR_PEP_ID=MMETSP0413-20121227/9670_1 /TAXON_ID=136452 /ORGANISM="Filamoeba nolandi, Strain NC-AS-23-1" /LENGTH=120 /DNA_ID=CAMNT_0008588959 /DNA_START=108 /DNA_END=466 /DNA_ORIENTATION=-
MDKTTGNKSNITIKYQKGRLSEDDITRIIKEAEKYKEADEKAKKRVEAKNDLENFAYSIKNTLHNEQTASKLSQTDKDEIERVVKDTLAWLDTHQQADTEEYESKKKDLESKTHPIMMKL